MIYGYGLWRDVENQLHKDLPNVEIRNKQKYNQIRQAILKGWVSKSDLIFFLRFSEGDQRLQDQLHKEGYNLFPNPEFSKFIRNRGKYLREIDKQTKYALKRVHLDKFPNNLMEVIRENFKDNPVVLKVGNLHASEGKYLIKNSQDIPHLKYKQRQMPITIEEFIPDARSIRIGLIGDPFDIKNYFITEHVNSKTWLKNFAPEEEVTYFYNERYDLGIDHIDKLIYETMTIAFKYNANLLGVDWVVSPTKTGLLELNDMIGLPEGDFSLYLFSREVEKVCMKHINEQKRAE